MTSTRNSRGTRRVPLFVEANDEQIKKMAIDLAKQVDQLNPNCQQIGAGYMANMRELAARILALVK